MDALKKCLEVEHISKTFFNEKGYFTAIDDVSFDVREGEFLVLLGPGHCGKTVLLNILAGLEEKSGGRVLYKGKEINGVNRIYDFIQQCSLRGWIVTRIDVESRIDIYNAAEVDIEFDD